MADRYREVLIVRYASLLALFFSLSAFGQNISASLSGSVKDSSGAVFTGAAVKLADANTGFVRVTQTNSDGFFSFPNLTPGLYNLDISAPGFKQYRQEKIELNSGDSRSAGEIKLELGAVSESVTVTAEAASVMLGSSERAGVVTSADMKDMALRGRDFMDVVGLLPGVTDTSDSREAPN